MPKTAASSPTKVKKTRSAKSAPTREEIALRAYEIYLERGQTPGHELEDWTRAERELMQQNGKPHRRFGPRVVAA